MQTTATQDKANGLATYFSVLTSPSAAFDQLAKTPMWGWASLIGMALMLVSIFIGLPANMHYGQVAQQAALAQMPADQRDAAQASMTAMRPYLPVISVVFGFIIIWFFWVLSALVFLGGAALTGAEAKFNLAWVAAVNSNVVYFVGAIMNSIILMVRGPENANTITDLFALPSLGMLVHGSPKLIAFLYGYNVVNLWYYAVLVIGLERVLRMKRGPAIGTVLVFSLIGSAFGALAAR